jgi:Uma2 family endonuclease
MFMQQQWVTILVERKDLTMNPTIGAKPIPEADYPTTDGRPMAETDVHRILMTELIETLSDYFANEPNVYVSGNLLVFYAQNNRRKLLSPDVFVVRGVSKELRNNYLIWKEGKAPEIVIELTSESTREEDTNEKYKLYQTELKVKEYILFDPLADYLEPSFQAYHLVDGIYQPLEMLEGRYPSQVLGLHLERVGNQLRLWDPKTQERLLTRSERITRVNTKQTQLESENERLRQELETLRKRLGEIP